MQILPFKSYLEHSVLKNATEEITNNKEQTTNNYDLWGRNVAEKRLKIGKPKTQKHSL